MVCRDSVWLNLAGPSRRPAVARLWKVPGLVVQTSVSVGFAEAHDFELQSSQTSVSFLSVFLSYRPPVWRPWSGCEHFGVMNKTGLRGVATLLLAFPL